MSATLWQALAGGALIGLASALLLLCNGRIAGVCGIVGGAIRAQGADLTWRLAFCLGLVLTGVLATLLVKNPFDLAALPSTPVLLGAGLVVGFGTRLANGCTSGHGVCGLSRGSPRSLTATLTFMGTAAATVFVMRHCL